MSKHPFASSLEPVKVLLAGTKERLEELLSDPELALIKERYTQLFKKELVFIGFQLGEDQEVEDSVSNPKRVTTFLGKQISQAKADEPKADTAYNLKNVAQQEAEEVKAQLPQLIESFMELDSDNILDQFTDLQIRAIGKSAGLPVTADYPEKTDAVFIGEVKDAINKTKQLAAVASGADGGNDGNIGAGAGAPTKEDLIKAAENELSTFEAELKEAETSNAHHMKIKSLQGKVDAAKEKLEGLKK